MGEMSEGGRDKETPGCVCVCVCVCPSDCHLPLFGGYRSVGGSDVGEWVGLEGGWIRVIAP